MSAHIISGRPEANEYSGGFGAYIDLVPETDILAAMDQQQTELDELALSAPQEQVRVLHPPYTWTLCQVVGHLIDGERIFGYRAARFAAGDATPLPGFDQDAFVAAMDYAHVTFAELLAELRSLRQSNLMLLRRLPRDAWLRRGTADGRSLSVRATAYVITGHVRHHLNIINKRLQ